MTFIIYKAYEITNTKELAIPKEDLDPQFKTEGRWFDPLKSYLLESYLLRKFQKNSRFLVLAESKHVDDYIRMLDEVNESFVFHTQKTKSDFRNSFLIGMTLPLLGIEFNEKGEPTKLSKSSEAALSLQLRDYKRCEDPIVLIFARPLTKFFEKFYKECLGHLYDDTCREALF